MRDFHHGLVSYSGQREQATAVKYANQINTALVVASALFVVYALTQTYWSADPVEEIVRPIQQERRQVDSPSPEASTPSPEPRIPTPRRLPPAGSETDPVEPSTPGSSTAAPTVRPGEPGRRAGGRSQSTAPRRLTPSRNRPAPVSRTPVSRPSRQVPPISAPSGGRAGRPLTRPPREIVPEEKRQTGDPAPTPPVRSSVPEQRLPDR